MVGYDTTIDDRFRLGVFFKSVFQPAKYIFAVFLLMN